MSKGTPRRSVRVGDLWEEAQQVATRRGDNISEVIRQALAQYVQDNQEGIPRMISDEAVEAAAKAGNEARHGWGWDSLDGPTREAEIFAARFALKSAAPHMLAARVAAAKANHDHIVEGRDGYSAGFHYALHCIRDETNPHSSQT